MDTSLLLWGRDFLSCWQFTRMDECRTLRQVSKAVDQTVGDSCPPSPRVDFWTLLTSSHVSGNHEVAQMLRTKIDRSYFLWHWWCQSCVTGIWIWICMCIWICIWIWMLLLLPDSRLVPQVANLWLVTAGRSLLHNCICISLCISLKSVFLFVFSFQVGSFVKHFCCIFPRCHFWWKPVFEKRAPRGMCGCVAPWQQGAVTGEYAQPAFCAKLAWKISSHGAH